MNIDMNKAIEVLQACGYECEEIMRLREDVKRLRDRGFSRAQAKVMVILSGVSAVMGWSK